MEMDKYRYAVFINRFPQQGLTCTILWVISNNMEIHTLWNNLVRMFSYTYTCMYMCLPVVVAERARVSRASKRWSGVDVWRRTRRRCVSSSMPSTPRPSASWCTRASVSSSIVWSCVWALRSCPSSPSPSTICWRTPMYANFTTSSLSSTRSSASSRSVVFDKIAVPESDPIVSLRLCKGRLVVCLL